VSTDEYCFLEPLDVLFLRGNKLFGDPGSFGEAIVPPWPSVAVGALRSRMLVDAKADLSNPESWPEGLGTPEKPGSFGVMAFHLARRFADGRVECLIAPPADLVITRERHADRAAGYANARGKGRFVFFRFAVAPRACRKRARQACFRLLAHASGVAGVSCRQDPGA
jgi:hypothetical protein